MKKIMIAFIMLTLSLSAYQVENIAVNFTAFKTYAKKGVSGTFNKVIYTSVDKKSINDMLLNSSVKIDTQSVNSGNKGRDIKLVSYFFNIQDVKFIKAKIVEIKNSNIIVKISMNSKSLNIPMSYKVQNNTIIANGTIDLADFDMLTSLSAINKACYTLHQGKTWQDVNISFEIKYK